MKRETSWFISINLAKQYDYVDGHTKTQDAQEK